MINLGKSLGERDADVLGVNPFHGATSVLVLTVLLPQLDAAAFLHVISRVHGEFHGDVALDHGLAAKAGVRPQVPGRVQAIELVVLGFAQILLPLHDIQVTGCAGAAASARMLEPHAVVHRHIEERLRQAVTVVRHLAVFELDDGLFPILDKGDLWHYTSVTFFPASASRTPRFIMTSARCCVAWLSACVLSWINSRSVALMTCLRSASAVRMRSSSPAFRSVRATSSRSGLRSDFSVARMTVSASFRASIRSRAAKSASACSNDSMSMRSTSPSVRP